jgi:peroxiredoxin
MRFIVLLGLVLALAVCGIAQAADAPDFELEGLDGEEYALKDLLKGCDLLVIDFWQVGCKPCNELVAHLQGYYDEYQEEGVEFVIISRDTALTLAQVAPFFRANEYTFRVLLDTELDVSKDYGVNASPVTFIISPEGEIIWQHYNYRSGQEKEIEEVIEKYLAGEKVEFPEDDGAEE